MIYPRKATEMRNAIDMIEGALMGLGDFIDLPDMWTDAPDTIVLSLRLRLGQIRRVCNALSECTRIINSEEYDV